jgi:UDP-2,3-diacylglucosamine pyrophosphatase LpxH
LHIGDRSPRDNFCQANRERRFESLLDYVQDQKGKLVIVGDLFELLRYPLDGIIAKRRGLLDRLADMNTVYVPGNHDEDAAPLAEAKNPPHPFFAGTSRAFVQQIGGKRFKFMHGHEVDPLTNAGTQGLGRMIGTLAYFLEFRQGTCILSNDTLTDALLEIGEQFLWLWGRARRRMSKAWRECYGRMPAEKVTGLTQQIRTRRMLARYYEDRNEDLYDIAIVGHTHKAGTFGNWYFNSGSWTGHNTNFLRIAPDGEVGVFDWTDRGPRLNDTVVA